MSGKIHTSQFCGAIWYDGQGALEAMYKNANPSHRFFVAQDVMYSNTKKTSKSYASYKSSSIFYEKTKGLNDKAFYVIIPEAKECCLYADLEWETDWKSEDEVKRKYIEVVKEALTELGHIVDKKHFFFLTASEGQKGSLHAHIPSISFKNIEEQKRFHNKVFLLLKKEEEEWFFIDKTEKSLILKTFIDFGVYNKNRLMRLPYSSKMKRSGELVRPLRPMCPEKKFLITNYTITDVDKSEAVVDVSGLPIELECSKQNIWSKKLLEAHLEDFNLEVSVLKGAFAALKNKRTTTPNTERKCPVSGTTHKSNNQYLVRKGDCIYIKCHSERCSGREKLLVRRVENNKEVLEKNPPFKEWRLKFLSKERRWGEMKNEEDMMEEVRAFQRQFVSDMNRYVKTITGYTKIYYSYRVQYENSEGREVIEYLSKNQSDFIELFKPFDCVLSRGKNNPTGVRSTKIEVISAKFFCNHHDREEYLYEDCLPYEKTPSHIFNSYTGLAISKTDAYTHGNTDPTYFLDFIKKAWCGGNEDKYNYVLNWMAYNIQFPHRKVKTSIVLTGQEGTGKGSPIQVYAKIFGYKHYLHTSDLGCVIGNWNSSLKHKLLLFLDEASWGGDKHSAGALKALLTEERITIKEKYMPEKQMTNLLRVIFASNNDWVVPAGTAARRYTVLETTNHMIGLTDKEKALIYNFCPYSLAKVLYRRDVSSFNPNKPLITEELEDQKSLTMPPLHKFWVNYVESDAYTEGWNNKESIYDYYCMKNPSYPPATTSFWRQSYKLIGKLRKRQMSSGERKPQILLPSREEMKIKINTYYGGNMFEDNSEDDDDLIIE